MKISPKLKNSVFQISALLILFAAVLYNFDNLIAKYVMVVGVTGFLLTTFTSPYQGSSLRGKRLFNMQIFAVLLMAVSAYLMFRDIMGWVVTLLIAALLILYSSILLSRIDRKEKGDDKDKK